MSFYDLLISKFFGGGAGGSGGASVQSDLAQNDPTASDYVKNRTHWLGSRTLVSINDNKCDKLLRGKYYDVVIDGVEYICECMYTVTDKYSLSNGAHYLGNPKWIGEEDNGLPFLLVRGFHGFLSSFFDDNNTHDISVYSIGIDKLPPEYLPSGTSYNRYSETLICENVTVTTSDLMGTGLPMGIIPSLSGTLLKEGMIYDVIWNGTKYTCDTFPFSAGDGVYVSAIGNRSLQISNGMDTGEPFLFTSFQGNFGCMAKDFTTATVSIIEHTKHVQKLGDEYYDRVLFVDLVANGIKTEGDSIYTTDITPEALKDAYNRGIPICARLLENSACLYFGLVAALTVGNYWHWEFSLVSTNSIYAVYLDKSETNDAYEATIIQTSIIDIIDARLKELGIID